MGNWQLDRAASHFTGFSLTIGRTAHGYHFDFGAVSFEIGDDGRDYPTVPSRTTSIRPVGDREWVRVHKTNGTEVDHGTLTVTPDGTKLKIHTVATATDGSVHEEDETMRRIGTGSGLDGTWQSEKAGANVSATIVVEAASADKYRWSYPAEGQFFVLEPNGPPVAVEGSRAVPGVTLQLRSESPTKLTWIESVNGKPYTQGVDELLDRGSSLQETTWPVHNPAERQVAVYRRK